MSDFGAGALLTFVGLVLVVGSVAFGFDVSAKSMVESCTKAGVYMTKNTIIKCEVKAQ